MKSAYVFAEALAAIYIKRPQETQKMREIVTKHRETSFLANVCSDFSVVYQQFSVCDCLQLSTL